MIDRKRRVVLATGQADLERTVLAAGAAVGRLIEVVDSVEQLAAAWADAASVLIGSDLAAQVVERALQRRGGVFVVSLEADRVEACGWSVPLGAAVLVLPEGSRWLSSVISGAVGDGGPVVVIGVLAGSGGAGASTLAAGLALAAARSRRRAALVDVDVVGGGIDLLLGAEEVSGWRWSRLRTARGQIGDLTGKVPAVDGVDLVAMGREAASDVGRDALTAVVSSLARSHEVVVLDIGRGLGAAGLEAVRMADRLVVACGQDVRSAAAARMVLTAAGSTSATGVVVRKRQKAAVSAVAVADALGLPLWGTVPDERALTGAADRGLPPAIKRWSSACDAILTHVAPHHNATPPRTGGVRGWLKR